MVLKMKSKRKNELTTAINSLGFIVVNIEDSKKHIKCTIQDDAGNEFIVVTGSTPAKSRSTLKNFKQNVF